MATTQQDGPHASQQEQERRQRSTAVGDRVLGALGQPGDFLRMQVREVWEGHYRVNVFVGPDAASARVSHSYFLEADGDGNILACTPNLTRQH